MPKDYFPYGEYNKDGVRLEKCAHCKRLFEISQLGDISDAILKHKPACSFECNKALGQVSGEQGK
jgi:hypothetical protein